MEEQKEIQKQFRQDQEKYVYYIIALCVAAIGFSVHETIGASLKLNQIPLGFAVCSWALCVFYGLRFLEKRLEILFDNNQYFEILQGRDEVAGNHPEKIIIGANVMKNIMKENSPIASKYFKNQKRYFFLGFISFMVWHIIVMYKNTL